MAPHKHDSVGGNGNSGGDDDGLGSVPDSDDDENYDFDHSCYGLYESSFKPNDLAMRYAKQLKILHQAFYLYDYYFKLNTTQGSLMRGKPYHLRKFRE